MHAGFVFEAGEDVAADEVDRAVMRAPETDLGEDGVRSRGEVAVGVEQQLDSLPQFLLAQEERVYAGGFRCLDISHEIYAWK